MKIIEKLKTPENKLYFLSGFIAIIIHKTFFTDETWSYIILLSTVFIISLILRKFFIKSQKSKYGRIDFLIDSNYYYFINYDVKLERHFFGLNKIEKELLQELNDIEDRFFEEQKTLFRNNPTYELIDKSTRKRKIDIDNAILNYKRKKVIKKLRVK